MNYYFLGTLLPELEIGIPPEMSQEEFVFFLKANLTDKDLERTRVIRRFFDLENIRAFWSDQPIDARGNFDPNTLEEALLIRSGLPDYVYRFMDAYETTNDRLTRFSALFAAFFREEIAAEPEGFLRDWLIFERELRLVLVALRAKTAQKNILTELQYEDPYDPFIAPILAQKDAKSYEPPVEFHEVQVIYETYEKSPLDLHKALTEYQFRRTGALVGLHRFTSDRILAYLFQLILAEKWIGLDPEKGQNIINVMLQEDS